METIIDFKKNPFVHLESHEFISIMSVLSALFVLSVPTFLVCHPEMSTVVCKSSPINI